MVQKKIVILGGSYGGASTAHSLLKHAIPTLPEKESYQVVMISASNQLFNRPAAPRALISDDMFPRDKLFPDTTKQFEQYPKENFRFIHGTAKELDHIGRTVTVQGAGGEVEKLEYYALVIATGASANSPLFGLKTDTVALREAWAAFRSALPTAKSIVIAGAGPTGVETAGELGEYLNGTTGGQPKVKITLITASTHILPSNRPVLGAKAEKLLNNLGVTVVKGARVLTVFPQGTGTLVENVGSKATVSLDNGTQIDADLYIPAIGVVPNTSFVDRTLLCEDGRVETNPSTMRVDKAGPRIYAIGDASSYAKAAIINITAAVPILAVNIKRDLLLNSASKGIAIAQDRIYKESPKETCLVPIGTKKGVGVVFGWQVPSLFVWGMKGRDYWLWTTDKLWSGKQFAQEGS